jgi:hypothetical protein
VIEKLTKAMFSENLNTKFRIYPEGSEPFEAELIELAEVNASPKQEQFSATFRGPLNIVLSQGLYRMEHDQMGAFDLFIVPIHQDQDGVYYEAVFNRLIKNV